MNYVHNAPRSLRVALAGRLGGDNKLYVLSPKQTGRVGWWFATIHNGRMVRVGKRWAGATRDDARHCNAVERFGVPARELRDKKQSRKAA